MNRFTLSVICSPPASFVPVSVPLSVSVSLSGSLSLVGSLFLNFKYSWKIIVGNISRILFQMYRKIDIYIYLFIYYLLLPGMSPNPFFRHTLPLHIFPSAMTSTE